MMNQEEYVDVQALKIEGWTAVEMAEVSGFHPATIRKWLKQGPPVNNVPEASTLALSSLGGVLLWWKASRKRRHG